MEQESYPFTSHDRRNIVVLRLEYYHPSTVQHCHDGNDSDSVDLIPSSKMGCDGHRENPLLSENRRYAAMNFGHKVRDDVKSGVVGHKLDWQDGGKIV